MKNKIKKLLKSSFIRNVLLMASGTIGAQVITMLASPLITRLYGPDAFGIMGAFLAMIQIFIPIAALTFPIAIVLPKRNQEAKSLIRLSILVSLFISFISLLLIGLFNEPIAKIFNLNDVAGYLFLVPIVIILAALTQSIEQWLIRINQFSISARSIFLQSLIVNGNKVGIGFIYPFASVLIILSTLNHGIKALIMIFLLKKSNHTVDKDLSKEKKSLKEIFREYYDFPIYRAPQELINAFTNNIPTLMLAAFFGPASAGFYTIGRTVLRLPAQLIGKSVGDVFYPRIAKAVNNKENISLLLKRTTLALSWIGAMPFGIIILFGPVLFSFVFGNDWYIAGEYARWIALWSFTSFINRACVRSLPALNAQRFHLIYTIVMLVIRVAVLAIGYYVFKNDNIAIALFGVVSALLNLGLIYFTIKISNKRSVAVA